MKTVKEYLWFHFRSILKNKTFYVFQIVLYCILFISNFRITEKRLAYGLARYEEFIFSFTAQQIIICIILIVIMSAIIYEDYLRIYNNIFSIYIKKPSLFFYTMAAGAITGILFPFIFGEIVFCIINWAITGYFPMVLVINNILIAGMQFATLILFVITLFLLFKRALIVYCVYLFTLIFTIIINNVYITIPLTAGLIDRQGLYESFPIQLWAGRLILLFISLLIYIMAVKNFTLKNRMQKYSVKGEGIHDKC